MSSQPLSVKDRARLLLNSAELANRSVEFGNKTYPILHLSVGRLEKFRAAIEPIERLYMDLAGIDLPFINAIQLEHDRCVEVFKTAIPLAASIVLNIPEDEVRAKCNPIKTFEIVLAQWIHNLEISHLQDVFPHPDDDEYDSSDPNEGNPLSIIEKLASAYHWTYEEALSRTIPQIYLMGVSSAWSYEKIKNGDSKKAPIQVEGKRFNNFKDMSAGEYNEYLKSVMGGMPDNMGVGA